MEMSRVERRAALSPVAQLPHVASLTAAGGIMMESRESRMIPLSVQGNNHYRDS